MTPLYQPAIPLYRPTTGVSREHITNPHLIVVGDLFLAEHSCGLRSDEQAVPQFATGTQRDYRLVGAAHICQIMRELDATVSCVGMVGNDTTGWELRRQHEERCHVREVTWSVSAELVRTVACAKMATE